MRYTAAFMRKAWWLALVPAIPTTVHDLARIHALFPQRDHVQVELWLLAISAFLSVLATYWVIRFLVLNRSISAALSVNRESLSTFSPYAAFFTIFWFIMSWIVYSDLSPGVLMLVCLFSLCVESLFAPWAVAAPSGSKSIGPVVSLRHGKKNLIWGACLLAVIQVPFGISEILTGIATPYEGNVWLQSATTTFRALVSSITLTAICSAELVIAYRAGVRVNSSAGIEDIFT